MILLVICFAVVTLLVTKFVQLYRSHLKVSERYAHLPGVHQFVIPNFLRYFPSFIRKYIPNPFGILMFEEGANLFKTAPLFKAVFGSIPIVLIGDPDFAKLFISQQKNFKKAGTLTTFINDSLGTNVFSAIDHDVWKRHRTLLNQAFTDKSLECVTSVTVEVMNQWLTLVEKDTVRNVTQDAANLTLDVIGMAGFGYQFNSFLSNSHDSLAFYTKELLAHAVVIAILPQFLRKLRIGIFGRVQKALAGNMEVIGELINERLQQRTEAGNGNKDILQLLIDNAETNTDEEYRAFSKEELISNCFIFLIAGHETTALTLNFALYLLATNPDVQRKAHDFVDRVLPDKRVPTYKDLDSLSYIDHIIKESLRLYPVAVAIARTTAEDVNFKGYDIPKETLVIIDFCAFHKNTETFEDPERFNPDRFDEPKLQMRLRQAPYLFSPFGLGYRACIGKRFAMIEAVVALTMLLQRYTVKLADPNYKMQVKFATTMRPLDDLQIRFEPR